jgi:hypothetical protein
VVPWNGQKEIVNHEEHKEHKEHKERKGVGGCTFPAERRSKTLAFFAAFAV